VKERLLVAGWTLVEFLLWILGGELAIAWMHILVISPRSMIRHPNEFFVFSVIVGPTLLTLLLLYATVVTCDER